jgi:N-acyl-D-amino-acid deacylase
VSMRTLISNTYIADGETVSAEPKDLLIEGGLIAAITAPGGVGSRTDIHRLDADGRILSPGFIDTHAHSDHAPLLIEDDTSKILQGVTTEINGNCGFSLAPVNDDHIADFNSLVERIFPPQRSEWRSFSEYVEALRHGEFVTNFASLIGHNTIRIAAMGAENRAPTRLEMVRMEALIDEALGMGVAGLSTGLIYPPGVFSSSEEITNLARRLPSDAVYASHMRNESRYLAESIQETLSIAKAAGVRCHISHLKLADRRCSGKLTDVLETLEAERAQGIRVSQDIYPYTAASTMLSALLPPWMHDGGSSTLFERLHSADLMETARRQISDPQSTFENYGLQAGWDGVVIASTKSHRFEGESVASIAHWLHVDPVEAVAKILREEELKATMIVHAMNETDVRAALRDPYTAVGTDGLPVGTGGQPHPRGFGTFPRILQHYVREEGVISLAEALRRMTSLSADIFGLDRRGRIRVGHIADLVLFDPESVTDNATFAQPTLGPVGIDEVFIGGEHVVDKGQWTGRRAGTFVKVDH